MREIDGRKVAGGISVDQKIAQRIGASTPFESIQVGSDVGGSAISWKGVDQPVRAERLPAEAVDRFFDGFDASSVDTGRADRARRRRILDTLSQDVGQIRRTVGREDRYKIDAHQAALEDIYDRLDALESLAGTCSQPSLSSSERGLARDGSVLEATYVPVGQVMGRVAAAALTCDLSRVVSVQWGHFGSGGQVDAVGITSADDYHTKGHNSGKSAADKETYIRLWEEIYAVEFRTFLELLDAVPEPTTAAPDSTMLDNTLVLWMSSMASPGHGTDDLPYVIAGGRNLGLEGGRFLQYDGIAHNAMLVSLCQIMGLSDVDRFGDATYGTGPLPRLMA
jgi:hypothetical protein